MHTKYQKKISLFPHYAALKFSCGSCGGLCFALKYREIGQVYLNVRYTKKALYCFFGNIHHV